MRELEEWRIVDDGRGDDDIIANGNRLLIGNGYLGYRGTVEEADASYLVACNLSGLYDRQGEKWREPVNAPNGLFLSVAADGRGPLSIKDRCVTSHSQSLDFRYGIFGRRTAWTLRGSSDARYDALGDTEIALRSERFASMADPHLLCLRYIVSSSRDARLRIRQGIDAAVWDINGPHLEAFEYSSADCLAASCRTQELGICLAVASVASLDFAASDGRFVESSGAFREIAIDAEAGREYRIDVFCSIYKGLDAARAKPCDRDYVLGAAKEAALSARARGYEAAFASHKAKWDAIWEDADVAVEGDDYSRRALRYSLYQLRIIAPRHSRNLSIPARGLSGQTYKGAVFWDTEMFIAPYFLYTAPEVARSFIRYRIDTLDGARRKAAEYGYRGAFYAWESQETGDDACSLFNVVDVFTGRPMRTYFRDKQVHISADVAFSITRYVETTGDWSILVEGGLEVMLECARFFLSYAYYSPERGRYEILDVTGPDEYHERVNNDAFSSRMAKLCLDSARRYIDLVGEREPAFIAQLLGRLRFDEDRSRLDEMSEKLYVPQPGSDGVIEQFDGYYKLEDCSLGTLRSRLLDPKEYWGGANGVAASTRIIKQADVVLMLDLFGSDYSLETKKANLAFYEPRTEHGSSLSHCLYSLLACETGDSEWAYPFFRRTAEIDISGDSKQYAGLIYIGGTHPAASGGAWMAAILGFCGLSNDNGELRLSPRLPEAWTRVVFSLKYKGQRYRAEVTKEGYSLEKR
jgi:Trehalose and maltose hydrolases (possible phosphorylases)